MHELMGNSVLAATLLTAYQQSEWMGKGIIWVLFVGSIMVWSVMIGKRFEVGAMAKRTERFLNRYRRMRIPEDVSLASGSSGGLQSPVEIVFKASAELLTDVLRQNRSPGKTGTAALDDVDIGIVRGMAERMLAEQSLYVERNMSMLATATTTAPFLGLLGTVWGVMVAFQAMSGRGVVLLAEVAPGISSALLTTVVGLFVALPSAIGYNFLTGRVHALQTQMENFVDEFMADVARRHRQRNAEPSA